MSVESVLDMGWLKQWMTLLLTLRSLFLGQWAAAFPHQVGLKKAQGMLLCSEMFLCLSMREFPLQSFTPFTGGQATGFLQAYPGVTQLSKRRILLGKDSSLVLTAL